MKAFLIVNAVLIAACIWLIILQPSGMVWTAFIAAWCAADLWFAKDIHLSWWHWALVIAVFIAIDLIALRILGQI